MYSRVFQFVRRKFRILNCKGKRIHCGIPHDSPWTAILMNSQIMANLHGRYRNVSFDDAMVEHVFDQYCNCSLVASWYAHVAAIASTYFPGVPNFNTLR